jgi:iron complex transport system ATP-binding protein
VGRTSIELRDVVVRRRGRAILGPLSLDLPAGEFLGVVGPNGAGKTTLLRAMARMEPPSEGRVVVRSGEEECPCDARALARRRIGFLFQSHEFLPDVPLTVEDVVLFGRAPLAGVGRAYRREDREATSAALEELGMASMRRRLYRELSGGERQKVQLARLLAQGPEVLLLDEPTSGLDLLWQERLTTLVERMYRRSFASVVMVTHEIDRLPGATGRVLLLREGRPLECGPPEEVLKPRTLSRLYGCAMEVVPRGGRYHAFSLGEAPAGERRTSQERAG